jgi:hypothetical protein
MAYIADRVKETTTTTGTGAIILLGAVAQFRSFATAFGATPTLTHYAIVGQTGTEWEVGKGIFNGTTGLTREVIRSSSNAGALVNFSAGTKDVFVTANAELVDNANVGWQVANMRGLAMP